MSALSDIPVVEYWDGTGLNTGEKKLNITSKPTLMLLCYSLWVKSVKD